MKTIVIFGASGQTGQAVTAAAQAQGIAARTFDKRNPTTEDLRQAVRGADGVVIVFGPRPPYTDIFCAEATKNILRAMEAEGIRRLICQTGAMIGDYPYNRSFIFGKFSEKFRTSRPAGYADRVGQEEAIKHSPLEWTLIKPPRLTAGENDAEVRAGEHIKVGLLSSVSRKSLARFMIGELRLPRHLRQAVFIKN